jgi:chitin disaccharide deacetylase
VGAAPIILTADDFGRSAEVNEAIMHWARAGALTQASLMVNEPAASAAVALSREVAALRVGLHLTLCDGQGSDGTALPATPAGAGLKFAFWPGARAWLRKEIEAQFARFAELGLSPTYWDGHTHLHLHPTVMAIALPIAQRHGFKATRLVREPGPPALLPWIFRKLSERAIPQLKAAGIGFTDHVFGLRKTGQIDEQDFAEAFRWAQRGSVEIYFHPGAERQLPVPGEVADMLRKSPVA